MRVSEREHEGKGESVYVSEYEGKGENVYVSE